MEFVSSIENIMLKIGPTLITSAVVLDKRPDLDTLLRQLAAIVERVPRLRSKFRPYWGWHVREAVPVDLARHVARLDDPAIATPDDLETVLERVRCLELPQDRPPWLMIAVNAAAPDRSATGLPALFFHFDHSIADGIRALEVVTRLPSDPSIASAMASAGGPGGRLPAEVMSFANLVPDDRIVPLPLACVSAELAELKMSRTPGHDLSDQIIGAIDGVLNDGDLFDQGSGKRGKVALVRLTQRHVEVGSLGNHVAVVDRESVSAEAQATTRRGMLPSLKAERTTQARQVWMSPFPRGLTRILTRQWYAQFDALLTIIPGGRDLKSFADAPIDRIYGVAPFLAEIPINIAAITYGDRINLTLLPKTRFQGDKALLRRRFSEALASAPREQPATPVAEPAPVPRWAGSFRPA